ncbi:cysteine dioxygenase family protein [Orrella marina]|uniref:Cysteine dioxygenase n=1 Tax=Orrella marina TaxID=2163011 RepID=A0A2R4XKT4_9BURK|nr:hypothetical protein [Orrella marina]AWB34383.1 hypothetical protein DBV39_12460 [Orrella marina]
MDIQVRHDAVMSTIEQITSLGANLHELETREKIRKLLENLAIQSDLFPEEDFKPRPGASGGLYELYVAPDRSLSLYASAGASGKYQPPHDHTTWAVIAGIRGIERNQFFECLERDDATSSGTIRFVRDAEVGPGQSVTLAADEFHTIAVDEGGDALHLHLYGNALDTLVGRIGFESETGGQFKRFMAKPMTFAPWVTQDELEQMESDGKALTILSFTLGDLCMAVGGAGLQPGDRIVLIDAQSQNDSAAEEQVRALQRKGFHNIAVLKPVN